MRRSYTLACNLFALLFLYLGLSRLAPLAKTQKQGETLAKIFWGGFHATSITPTTHLHYLHQPLNSTISSLSNINFLDHLLSPSDSNIFPSYLSNFLLGSHSLLCSTSSSLLASIPYHLFPRYYKVGLPPHDPIYKTAHPSILEHPSRISTPVPPKPSILVSQKSYHTLYQHSHLSRVGCESSSTS